jgi:hypothetical protein
VIYEEMSVTITSETSEHKSKKAPTSMFLDRELWFKVRRAALERRMTTTKFVETALEKELKRIKGDAEH